MNGVLSLVLLSFGVFASSLWATVKPPVVYGADNRLDYYALDARTQAQADATAVLVDSSELKITGDTAKLNTVGYAGEYELCSEEPFYNQETAGFCTGFLVGPDLLITAGHCADDFHCNSTRFVFGFALTKKDAQPHSVPALNVYSCKEVLHSESARDGADFAVVRLDRSVLGVKPLSYRTKDAPALGDKLTVIGYPSGLPLKAANGATVLAVKEGYFVTDTDTYAGNSGSPVFSDNTGEVEGILVRGATDYVYAPGQSCQISNICQYGKGDCKGESVTLFHNVLSYLK